HEGHEADVGKAEKAVAGRWSCFSRLFEPPSCFLRFLRFFVLVRIFALSPFRAFAFSPRAFRVLRERRRLMEFGFPPEKRARVIGNTDAKNEADDQYAIVHAILTPSFELHGIIPAHFGTGKSATSLQDSHDEVIRLLRLMGLEGKVPVADGAPRALPDEG